MSSNPNQTEEVTMDDETHVPLAEYARVKTHLYGRIDTLLARAERAEALLIEIVDKHHRTLTASKLHDPEHQDWPECDCRTCAAVRELLPERAAETLAGYRAERAT